MRSSQRSTATAKSRMLSAALSLWAWAATAFVLWRCRDSLWDFVGSVLSRSGL